MLHPKEVVAKASLQQAEELPLEAGVLQQEVLAVALLLAAPELQKRGVGFQVTEVVVE